MLDPIPLSVFVITFNEEARLGRTLDAVSWADEIVVLDSGSTDATREIAAARGARVEQADWPGYGPQKARAEALCRHDWVLNLDADEVVTPALAAEIRSLFRNQGPEGPPPGAYRLRILNVYPGDARPRPLAADYDVVRLYHRAAGHYRPHPLFDRVELEEGIARGRLRAPVHHYPFQSWDALVAKENRYTSYVAATARPRPALLLRVRLVTEFPLVFLKAWLLRGHILGGWKGLAFSIVVAFTRTLRVIKLLERATGAGAAENDSPMKKGVDREG
ncbi:MAG: glycosyltransferase family 2 protein [Pseudomonadota bacterium]